MSVIVKGMEMPKNCKDCPFSDHEAWCLIPGDWRERYYCPDNERSEYCPLIDIPTPHGRLIDADKFAETLKEVSIRQGYDKLFSDNILSVGDVFDAIAADLKGEGLDKYKQAPTVIEAEGETDA